MKTLVVVVVLAVATGCGPQKLGGFEVFPRAPGGDQTQGGIGYSADGRLWVSYWEGRSPGEKSTARALWYDQDHWEPGGGVDFFEQVSVRELYEGVTSLPAFLSNDPVLFAGPTGLAVLREGDGELMGAPEGTGRCLSVGPGDRRYAVSRGTPDRVFEWMGTDWVELGRFPDEDVVECKLRFMPNGDPVLAFRNGSVSGLRRWDGAQWAPAASDFEFHIHTFDIDSQGRIWVVRSLERVRLPHDFFAAVGRGFPVTVVRWNGSTWEDLGGLSDLEGGYEGEGFPLPTTQMTARLDDEDRFVVAWATNFYTRGGTPAISVRRLGPGGWEDLGPSMETPGTLTFHPQLAIGPDGVPVVAWVSAKEELWSDNYYDPEVKVARFAGE